MYFHYTLIFRRQRQICRKMYESSYTHIYKRSHIRLHTIICKENLHANTHTHTPKDLYTILTFF